MKAEPDGCVRIALPPQPSTVTTMTCPTATALTTSTPPATTDPPTPMRAPRFAAGWPACMQVPNSWLPHLAALTAAVEAVYPQYQVAQVKEKFGALRFYLETQEPSCCQQLQQQLAHASDEALARAWHQHESSPEHRQVADELDRSIQAAEALIAAAERDSYTW